MTTTGMSQPTNRDRIWSAVLELAIGLEGESGRGFNIPMVLEEAGLEDSQRRTAQRVVGVMHELGWIEPFWTDRRSVRLWHPGDRLAAASAADDQEADAADAVSEEGGLNEPPGRGADVHVVDEEGGLNGGVEDGESLRVPSPADQLAAVDFPDGRDRQECEAAVLAAAEHIRGQGGASMREIVAAVASEHPCGYDVPDELQEGDRFRGAWWRKVVRPGLEAIDGIEAPGPGGNNWRPASEP